MASLLYTTLCTTEQKKFIVSFAHQRELPRLINQSTNPTRETGNEDEDGESF